MSVPVVPGEILAGKYRVEQVLGQGGMGVVVAATHIHLHQKVAIKLLLEEGNPEVTARFLHEARAAALLKSPHVIRILDVGELPSGKPFMVMEYLDGSDLGAVLRQQGRLPVTLAVDYLLQAGEALAEAHAAGIVHRDLKPENLFLVRDAGGAGLIKVLDFGISKDLSADPGKPKLTSSQTIFGSPAYMSPEQMRASRDVDARADLWSLGVLFYELLAGKVPFDGASFAELVIVVNATEPAPLSSFRDDVPSAVEAAILRCLEKDPARRFASIAQLAEILAPYGAEEGKRAAQHIARRALPHGSTVVQPAPGAVVDAQTREGGSMVVRGVAPGPRLLLLALFSTAALIGAAFWGIGALTHAPSAASPSAEPAPLAVPALAASALSTTSAAPVVVTVPASSASAATLASASAPVASAPATSTPKSAPLAKAPETGQPRPPPAAPTAEPPRKNQLEMPIK